MPKPITAEMIEAMGPSERKSLYGNALRLNTPAAKSILEMIAESESKMLVAKAKGPRVKSRSKAKNE